jgi:hypothetical protein
MFTYQQATGKLFRDDVLLGVGYSGHGEGKNCPEKQHIARVGPTPRGLWTMTDEGDTKAHGPCVIRLHPKQGTDTHGRDGFLMHGDSKLTPGQASYGCIIQSREIREFVVSRILAGEDTLEVVHG